MVVELKRISYGWFNCRNLSDSKMMPLDREGETHPASPKRGGTGDGVYILVLQGSELIRMEILFPWKSSIA
jgi:hypothetical protein